MAHIKTRNPSGGEYSFYSQDEFVRAIRRGAINPDWEVFHASTGQWLPITAHPAFSPAHADRVTTEVQREGTSELVLIYPPQSRPASKPADRGRDPIDSGPHVTLAEIERVLGSPLTRPSGQHAPEDRPWSSRQSGAVDMRASQSAGRKPRTFSIRAAFNNVRTLQRLLLVTTLLGFASLAMAVTPSAVAQRVVWQVQRLLFGPPSPPVP